VTGAVRVAVVGLGRMGGPIADHLIAAGYDVRVHDLSGPAVEARVARTNAESSTARLADEPRGRPQELELLQSVLASAFRLAGALVALEGPLYTELPPPEPPGLPRFVQDVQQTLIVLASRLRDGTTPLEGRPNLRADQNAMRDATGDDPTARSLLDETERITDSVNTIARLIETGSSSV